MTAKSLFTSGNMPNILKNIDDETALKIICLAIASNDLTTNVNALSKFPEKENGYFFYNSIGILREVAKQIDSISSSNIYNSFTEETKQSLSKLSEHLAPFSEGSLTKDTLKPIRDAHFHYLFPENETTKNLLNKIKGLENLEVGIKLDDDKLGSMRYTFSEWFRTEYMDSYLSEELSVQIAVMAVEISAFVDALLSDLAGNENE